uniref:Uncharacterized protein n=1 Tax=Solanum tuberosum TaxID=4113 RepID=M1DP06_SOLTU
MHFEGTRECRGSPKEQKLCSRRGRVADSTGIAPRRGLAPPRIKTFVRDAVVSRTLLSRNLIPNIFREQLRVADLFRDKNEEIHKSIFTLLKSPTKVMGFYSLHCTSIAWLKAMNTRRNNARRDVCQAIKEKIKSAIEKSSRLVAEQFRNAVPYHPNLQDLKDAEGKRKKAIQMTKGRIAEWISDPD